MPRMPSVVEDRSPLDGSHIDVAARIGWLLRVSRTSSGIPLRSMAAELRSLGLDASASALSRLESGGRRQGAVVDGYEQVLGLAPGRLRAAIDVLCRTFDNGPPDEEPDLVPCTLGSFSAAVEAVLVDEPRGGDWLRFAREHSGGRGFGLTAAQMEPLAARLAGEMGRSVGVAYTTRYEALSRLRCGPYAEVVGDVVRSLVRAPDTQVLIDLMIVVAERPTPGALVWAGELLSHERRMVMTGAALVLQNMRTVGGLPPAAWRDVVPLFLTAYAEADQPRRVILTTLFKNLPPGTRTAIKAGLGQRLEHVPGPQAWTRTRRNQHYEVSRGLATRICADLGLHEQPLLARLLFEVLFDFRATRVATSSFLLVASPVAEAVHPLLVETAISGADETTRQAARGALVMLQTPIGVPDVRDWLESPEEDLADIAGVLLGHAGVPLPEHAIEAGLAADEARVRRTIYSAGMARHPLLAGISTDPARTPAIRDAAAWWLREGGRVTD